jgi:hypothetical protein
MARRKAGSLEVLKALDYFSGFECRSSGFPPSIVTVKTAILTCGIGAVWFDRVETSRLTQTNVPHP